MKKRCIRDQVKDRLLLLMIELVQQKKIQYQFFIKGKTKFCLSLHYNSDENYLYVNKTEICKFNVMLTLVGIIFV